MATQQPSRPSVTPAASDTTVVVGIPAAAKECHISGHVIKVALHRHHRQATSMEEWEALQERHRTEIRALKAEVMKLKKGATQGDKKKKKDVTAQIGELESQLADRQSQEEKAFKEAHKELLQPAAAQTAPAPTEAVTESNEAAGDADEAERSGVPRVTRAAKRRV